MEYRTQRSLTRHSWFGTLGNYSLVTSVARS
jgi:hypothetical protein